MAIKKRPTKDILTQNLAREIPPKMEELDIILHDVRSMHNVGAVFRNADAFGVKKIWLSGFTPEPPRPEITKTAIGAEEFVEWQSVKNIAALVKELKKKNYLVIGLEQTDSSILMTEYEPPSDKNICLIFGNEVTGMDEEVMKLVDDFLEIPQYGHKHSLNVSVATGISLYAFLQKFWG